MSDDPCEEGYVQVGTKEQDGQTVPNCVPEEDVAEPRQQEDGPDCEEGYTLVGDKCVKTEIVEDVPPSALSEPKYMAAGSPLESEPIEREELEDGRVAYRNLKLLDTGVWTDEASKTPTLYDEETFENLELEYDSDGPPVNVSHDLDDSGEVNQASVGGYIDPDSVRTDGEALFADVVLETDTGAGQFLDDNIQSALESGGRVGFSPSVELTPTRMADADHPEAQEHVISARLSGTAFVRDPASKTVDFAHETANRAVAMSAEGQNHYTLKRVDSTMSDFDTEGMADELDLEEDEVASLLAEYQKEEEDEEEDEESEMAEDGGEEEEEEEEEAELEDSMPEEIMEEHANMKSRMEQLESDLAEIRDMMMSEEDTEALADADTVEEVEARLSEVEETTKELSEQPDPTSRKSLADVGGESESIFDSGRRMASSDSTGTTSR